MELNIPDAAYAGFSEQLFDWAPDAERLEREVALAEVKGRCDDLTRAEIECSLDLLDAELSSHRKAAHGGMIEDGRLRAKTEIRRHLASLALRMQRLPA